MKSNLKIFLLAIFFTIFCFSSKLVSSQSIELLGTLDKSDMFRMSKKASYISSNAPRFLGVDSTYTRSVAKEVRNIEYQYHYDIEVYKIVCPTTFHDSTIQVSGLIIVPKVQQEIPFMVYNHGTLLPTQNKFAPSSIKFNRKGKVKTPYLEFIFCAHWASQGCVVFMPDYIGYGESKNTEHPYCAYPFDARATYSLLEYGHQFVEDKVSWNNQLIVGGISEGALMGLGLHSYISQNHSDSYGNIISHLFAGPYQIHFNTYNFFSESWTPLQKSLYTWAFYYHLYSRNMEIADYMISDYKSSKEFCEPSFMLNNRCPKKVISEKGLEYISNLESDSLNNFSNHIEGEVNLYHGSADMVVAAHNTEKIAEILQKSNTNVKETYFDNKGHISGMYIYFEKMNRFLNNDETLQDVEQK